MGRSNIACFTGYSGECPSAPAIPNGSPCIEEVHLSCRRCCRDVNGTGLCEPELGAADLVDGTWCAQGYCRKSKCVNEAADYVTRHLNVLSDRSRIWPIIQSNIVAIIVLLSIAIYIPIGCCIRRAFAHPRVNMCFATTHFRQFGYIRWNIFSAWHNDSRFQCLKRLAICVSRATYLQTCLTFYFSGISISKAHGSFSC
ncbi:hypothetical protein COOONC_13079 [Cooperia oncophora]